MLELHVGIAHVILEWRKSNLVYDNSNKKPDDVISVL